MKHLPIGKWLADVRKADATATTIVRVDRVAVGPSYGRFLLPVSKNISSPSVKPSAGNNVTCFLANRWAHGPERLSRDGPAGITEVQTPSVPIPLPRSGLNFSSI
jgi:hypothetical protein